MAFYLGIIVLPSFHHALFSELVVVMTVVLVVTCKDSQFPIPYRCSIKLVSDLAVPG